MHNGVSTNNSHMQGTLPPNNVLMTQGACHGRCLLGPSPSKEVTCKVQCVSGQCASPVSHQFS
jgi:hypothetical protein